MTLGCLATETARPTVCVMQPKVPSTVQSIYCQQMGPAIAGRLNPLTPNDHYSGRTAPLTSKVAFYIFIQQI
jgi:hypothetical protein